MLNQYIRSFGMLRSLLHGLTLLFILLMGPAYFLKDAPATELFFGGVLPAMVPLILVVLMLDVLMSKVWKDGADDERRQQLDRVINHHLMLAAILLVAWLGVFLPGMII